jgi:hypothetical protein
VIGVITLRRDEDNRGASVPEAIAVPGAVEQQSDSVAEIAKVKEQNELLRKELEDLKTAPS